MQDPVEYRVMGRNKFAVAMVIMLIPLAVCVWAFLDWSAQYLEGLKALAEADPRRAETTLRQLIRALAISNAVVLLSLAALIVRHGHRGWRSAAMPPRGSWIFEGQRVWSGEPALRIARFTMVVGAILAVLAVASSGVLWRFGDTIAASA